MTAKTEIENRIERLVSRYGAEDGDGPSAAVWRQVLERDPERPITLINLFKLREEAHYPDGSGLDGSGREAFDRYATVSIPSMQSTGGEFLFVGPVEGGFIGTDGDWDIAAIGRYPSTDAMLSLFEIEAYQDCYKHRTAACEKQQVILCDG